MVEACYCEPGTMSQCVAQDYNEQVSCVGFGRSTVAQRCMHLNENMDRHCDSVKAQGIGLRDSDMTFDEAIPDLGAVDCNTELLEVEEVDEPILSCIDCKGYTCAWLKAEAAAAMPLGGLTITDLRSIKDGCSFFERN